jgi:hypothetical protein
MSRTDPHRNEGDAAAAAIADFYGKVWKPKPGDIVIVPEPFTTLPVKATVQHAYGDVVLVVTERGESLEYDRDEVQNF